MANGFKSAKDYQSTINNGFVKYTNGGSSGYNPNEAYARELNSMYGKPTAAQYNGLTTRDDYSVKDKYNALKTPTGGGDGNGTKTSSGVSADYLSSLYSSYASQRQAQMDAALGAARNAVNEGYNNAAGLLGQNYDSAKGALETSYANSLRGIKNDANQSLKEAYINKMKTLRDMPQRMTALGLNGGASESNLASTYNNYGNARANINMNTNNNISNLDADKAERLSSILQNYNSALASLQQQRASALASIEQSALQGALDQLDKQFSFQTSSGYLNALQNAANNSNFNATQAAITNALAGANTQQTDMSQLFSNTNYQEYLKRMIEQYLSGTSAQ